MAINQNTASTLSDWFSKAVGGQTGTAAPSSSVTSTAQSASPQGASVFGATAVGSNTNAKPVGSSIPSQANAPVPDVSSWYRNIAGREGEQSGLDFWNKELASGRDVDSVYKDFVKGTIANNDFNPTFSPNTPASGQTGGGQTGGGAPSNSATPTAQPALLDLAALRQREVAANQTVSGQLGGLLSANSDYIQSARDRALRASNARGLSNSSIAVSAGEDSAYQAALPIATSDAKTYGDVDAYNAALYNQGLMYNTDARNAVINKGIDYTNQSGLQAQQIAAERDKQTAALEAQRQQQIAQLDSERRNLEAQREADRQKQLTQISADERIQLAQQAADRENRLAQIEAERQRQQAQIDADRAAQSSSLGNQLTIAQLQAETNRYQAERNEASSKYNTDANVKNQAEQNKTTLVNNILQTTDLSPDRKAALLKQLGEPGLAEAIFIGSSIGDEMRGGNVLDMFGDAAKAASR